MTTQITVWTKPNCVQCRLVKARLTTAGVPYTEQDITAPENTRELEYFKGLGYLSAPITEYGKLAFAGFIPAEIDRIADAYRAAVEAPVRAPAATESILGIDGTVIRTRSE